MNKYLPAAAAMKPIMIIVTAAATLAISAILAIPATLVTLAIPAILTAMVSAEAGCGGSLSSLSSSLSLMVLVAGANKSLQSNNIIITPKI